MYLKRGGFPEESELLLCTVTKIQYNSVFVNIDEYGKQGMIHISEISPGRIRNIRDYIKEGKVIVCKVLRINQQRGHIDLSLRRVTDSQRRTKINGIKQEQLAEKILEFIAKDMKTGSNIEIDPKKLFLDIYDKVSQDYDSVYAAFQDIVEGGLSIDDLGVDNKKVAAKLEETIRQRIKPQEVEIKGELSLETYAPDGIEIVKDTLLQTEKVSDKLELTYEGGGKYRLTVKAHDYKEAEAILKKAYETAIDSIEKTGGEGSFVRAES